MERRYICQKGFEEWVEILEQFTKEATIQERNAVQWMCAYEWGMYVTSLKNYCAQSEKKFARVIFAIVLTQHFQLLNPNKNMLGTSSRIRDWMSSFFTSTQVTLRCFVRDRGFCVVPLCWNGSMAQSPWQMVRLSDSSSFILPEIQLASENFSECLLWREQSPPAYLSQGLQICIDVLDDWITKQRLLTLQWSIRLPLPLIMCVHAYDIDNKQFTVVPEKW